MTTRLAILLAMLAALAACAYMVLREPRPPGTSESRADLLPMHKGESAASKRPGPYPTEYDEVTVSIEIPPLSEFPTPWGQLEGCPQTRMTLTLGVTMYPAEGCPVLTLDEDGPAARAGIKPGDRLGGPDDCANSLSFTFRPKSKARTVEWTVRRPKAGESEEQATSG